MPDEASRSGEGYPFGGLGTAGLIERSIVLLLVLGLLFGVLTILWPFTTAILFGAALAIATWPLRQEMIGWGIRPGFAAALLLLLSIVIIAVPVLVVAPVLKDQLAQGKQGLQTYFAAVPEEPTWLTGLPLIGSRLDRMAIMPDCYVI